MGKYNIISMGDDVASAVSNLDSDLLSGNEAFDFGVTAFFQRHQPTCGRAH